MGSCFSTLRATGDNVRPMAAEEEAQFTEHVFQPRPQTPTDDAALYKEMQMMGLHEIPETSLFTESSNPSPTSETHPPLTGDALNYGLRTGRMSAAPKTVARHAWDAASSTKSISQFSGGSDRVTRLRAKLAELKQAIDDLGTAGDNLTGEKLERHEKNRQATIEAYFNLEERIEAWEDRNHSAQGK
jgi:hypothetical protein